jgi:hypothetical protein
LIERGHTDVLNYPWGFFLKAFEYLES